MRNNSFDDKLPTTLLISIVYPLGSVVLMLMPVIVGGVIDDYGFSLQQAGTLGSVEGIGLVVASLVAVLWIRKISWTKVLLASFLLMTLLNLSSANLNEYTLLLVTRFIAGFTGGTIFAVVVAALGDNRHPDRAFGMAQAVQGAMLFMAFSSAPYLIQNWGVSGLYSMLACVYFVAMLTLFRFPSQGVDHEQLREQAGETQDNTILIWIGLFASVIFFISLMGFWTFIERIGQAAGLPTNTIGLALGVAQIIAIGGAVFAAWASDRFGRNLPLLIVLVGQAWVLWTLAGQFTSTTFFIASGVFQALFMVGVSYQMGAIAKIDLKGKFLVLMTAAQGLGVALGPMVSASVIGEGQDYSGINLISVLLLLASILMFLFIIYRSRAIDSRLVLA